MAEEMTTPARDKIKIALEWVQLVREHTEKGIVYWRGKGDSKGDAETCEDRLDILDTIKAALDAMTVEGEVVCQTEDLREGSNGPTGYGSMPGDPNGDDPDGILTAQRVIREVRNGGDITAVAYLSAFVQQELRAATLPQSPERVPDKDTVDPSNPELALAQGAERNTEEQVAIVGRSTQAEPWPQFVERKEVEDMILLDGNGPLAFTDASPAEKLRALIDDYIGLKRDKEKAVEVKS